MLRDRPEASRGKLGIAFPPNHRYIGERTIIHSYEHPRELIRNGIIVTSPNTPAETPNQPAQSVAQPATEAGKPGKLQVSDLITIGVFAALYFVMVCIATLVNTLAMGGFGSIFLPAVAALISGCVYMLLAARLGKFGGITVMGLVVGLFLFVSGHFVLSFIASIVFPVTADLIARAGKYKSKALLLVSYVVFSYGLTGPILPLWFMKDAYVASLQARGKDAAYIDGVFANINTGSFFLAMGAILICAALGGWFGQKMLKKHFVKAGII